MTEDAQKKLEGAETLVGFMIDWYDYDPEEECRKLSKGIVEAMRRWKETGKWRPPE